MRRLQPSLLLIFLLAISQKAAIANDGVEAARLLGPKSSSLLIAQNDPSKSSLPGVQGITESRARDRLKERGFNKVISYGTSEKVKCPPNNAGYLPGIVCETNPPYIRSGSDIPVDTEIALLVQGERAADEEYGFPPKVIGMSRAEAVKALASTKWNVETLTYVFKEDASCPAGTVCRLFDGHNAQQRPDGSWDSHVLNTVPRRISPNFTLSIGSKYHRGEKDPDAMVDLTGYSFDEALDKLDQLGTRGGIGLDERHGCKPEVEAGRVCWQSLRAGDRTTSFGRVYFGISKGRGPLPARSADDSPFSKEGDQKKKEQ